MTNVVVATLPAGGTGSAGTVEVLSSGGVPSNAVPLTQWSGQLTYTENDSIPNLSGQSGSGSGTIQAIYNLVFRSDVHPTVTAIDTPAQPQNLYFNGPQGISIGHVTAFTGMFTTDDGMNSATFSTNAAAPPLLVGVPPLPSATLRSPVSRPRATTLRRDRKAARPTSFARAPVLSRPMPGCARTPTGCSVRPARFRALARRESTSVTPA
jgi:hypothetical protein